VQRAFGRFDLGLDVLAAGERKDFGWPKPVTLDSYVLANLTARWQLTPAVALVGRVENLLDEQYELAHTFNTPDRGVYVALRYAPGVASAATVARRDPPSSTAAGAYSAASQPRHPERPWAID
jgi:outer membrane receptor protein involved in Fe transport